MPDTPNSQEVPSARGLNFQMRLRYQVQGILSDMRTSMMDEVELTKVGFVV